MKIGIITQPLHINYGGILQNFALQRFLRDNGHDVVTLDWERKRFSFARQFLSQLIRQIKAFCTLSNTAFRPYVPNEKEFIQISHNTSGFIKDYINRVEHITTSKDFLSYTQKLSLNALVVGSDQVWRPLYCHGFLHDMFLGFAKDLKLKRIAYSVSFGTDKWEFTEEETVACREFINKFDAVSVRESSAISLCSTHFNVRPIMTLDPTMLLDVSVYNSLISKSTDSRCYGLFYYILDPSIEKTLFVQNLAKELNLSTFTVMPKYQVERLRKWNTLFSMKECIYPHVQEWLSAFRDAKYVVCDSFHGCVFSILYNKDFYVISNSRRGNARLESLLSTFGLQDRIIEDLDNFCIQNPHKVDWSPVNESLGKLREYSKDYLLKALKND